MSGAPDATRSGGSDEPPFRQVGIVGLGLIGGSVALAARERWPSTRLVAVDHDQVVAEARRRSVVDVAATELSALRGTDLVILAAPVRQNHALLLELPQYLDAATVITDCGSTKREIVALALALPGHLTFVGGHPLGGAATGGLAHATADLFRDRPWLITPGEGTAPAPVDGLVAFAAGLGALPRVMTAAEHDRLLAFVSHLPQLTASALMHVVGHAVPAEQLTLSGRGLIDTTRLAASPAAIWRDIAGTNADEIGPALDALIALLQELRGDLASGDRLFEVFTDAAASRRAIS